MSCDCGVFFALMLKPETPDFVMDMLRSMAQSVDCAESFYEQNKELFTAGFFDESRWAHAFTERLSSFPYWHGAFVIDDEREKSIATSAVVNYGTVHYCQQFLEWLRPWIDIKDFPAAVSVCESTPEIADMLYVLESGTVAQVSKDAGEDLTKVHPATAMCKRGLLTTLEENMKQ